MSDPRIDTLAKSFAALFVAMVDIAKSSGEITDIAVEEEAPRPTRKLRAQPAASQPDTSESATAASEASQAPKESSQATQTKSSDAGESVVGDADVFEKVKTLTMALSKARGREAALELLTTFGVARATALKPAQWAEYIEATETALEGDLV